MYVQEVTGSDSRTAQVPASAADKSAADLENWLRQNVVVQYWKSGSECESQPSTNCRFSNIALDWFVFNAVVHNFFELLAM